MCGIVGIVDVRGRRQIDRGLLARMNEVQFHRGPDEGGQYVADGVGLGHRRLSIIDLATGQQPLFNEDNTVALVYNGEIYNYRELITELTSLGHVFRTRSDTEVIVHAWESWGERCVERFRGMFAFALWDENKQTLFLARDRLGVKPLYYAELPDGLVVFSSELKSLLVHGTLDRRIDVRSVADYFTLGYVPQPRTIFAGARKLPAAHTLAIRRGQPVGEARSYWDVRFTLDRRINAADAAAELRHRLDETVRMRLVSEVPLGAFLSGGVDSSAVVASMARVSDGPVNTCSIAFADPRYDESVYAREVAERYGTHHHVDRVDTDDFDLVDALAGLYDEPFADSSAIPTYRVCQLARRHVTVALSGDGGDETFGGYRRYRTHLREERLRHMVPAFLRHGPVAALGRAYPDLRGGPRFLRARPLLQALARDPVSAYLNEVSVMRDVERAQLFTPAFRQSLGGYSSLDLFREVGARAQTDDPLALIQYLDMKTYLVDDINTKVDRASMAHALETREPLMDHELIEWMGTLPSSLKIRGNEGKYLLKAAMEERLPEHILYRRKMGFAVPLAEWFRGPLRARVGALGKSEALLDTGIFSAAGITDLVDMHRSGVRDYSAALWSLLMFESFAKGVAQGRVRPDRVVPAQGQAASAPTARVPL
jgi:asparagine synthase (glutamine-hydrolysing)